MGRSRGGPVDHQPPPPRRTRQRPGTGRRAAPGTGSDRPGLEPGWPVDWQRHYAAARVLLGEEQGPADVLPGVTVNGVDVGTWTTRQTDPGVWNTLLPQQRERGSTRPQAPRERPGHPGREGPRSVREGDHCTHPVRGAGGAGRRTAGPHRGDTPRTRSPRHLDQQHPQPAREAEYRAARATRRTRRGVGSGNLTCSRDGAVPVAKRHRHRRFGPYSERPALTRAPIRHGLPLTLSSPPPPDRQDHAAPPARRLAPARRRSSTRAAGVRPAGVDQNACPSIRTDRRSRRRRSSVRRGQGTASAR